MGLTSCRFLALSWTPSPSVHSTASFRLPVVVEEEEVEALATTPHSPRSSSYCAPWSVILALPATG